MSKDAPATLTRLLDEMPVGQPPLADVLASGRAAKRRRRRVQVGAVSLVVLVVMGGSFAFSRLGPTGGDTLVADGATNGNGLNATVEAGDDALTSRGLASGEAAWDPDGGGLMYASRGGYSSSCPPTPAVTDRDGTLSLQLAHADVNAVCTADAVPVVVTVTGLASPPEHLTVSEEGNPTEVVEVVVSTSANTVNLPTNDWKPGEPGHQALLTGTLALDENGCVALDHPPAGTRTYATWPSGYTATSDEDGLVTLHDSDGNPVARSGDTVQMGGGFHPADRIDPHPCLPQGQQEIASVQSEVTVVPPPQPGGSEPGPYTVYGGLSCPFAEQTSVALDIPGPGQPTPQEAVAPFLGSLSISAVHTKERAAQVIASDADGAALIVYSLTQQEDGWWPDGYTECRR